MHACGHDGHTAIALGTAYYLQSNRQNFAGTIKIIFQPAEEGPGGAKPMIEAGVLKNPDVDAIIGLHLWNNLPLGTVGVRAGALMAAVECFKCTILGKGGHGAMPHQTVDSIVVAAQIVNALQTIVSRNVDPIDSAVVTVGELHAGTKVNVIPDTARMSGTIRYFKPDLKGFFKKRIEQIIAGICQSFGASYDLEYWELYPPTVNDAGMAEFVRSQAEQGKKFLFVGTKRQAAGIIAQEAARCGSHYINQRWLGGMLTNWTTIKTRVDRLKDLERREENGALDLLPKKEASMLRREMSKLQKYLGGIKSMRKVPDIVVIVDQKREYNAVQECQKLSIPIVSLLDTNCDPDVVDIPIPANDDAIRSIKLIVGKLADAIYEGRHGQLDGEYEDEDYDGGEYDEDYDETEYTDSVIPDEEEEES